MKILTAHQPAYLPWLGLFHKIALADVYIFMDDVKYSKSDFSNRNNIYMKQKQESNWLTIPLKTKGNDNIIFYELEIDNSSKWKQKHIGQIRSNYAKTPFIKRYLPEIIKIIERPYTLLCDLTYDLLIHFLKILDIKVKVLKASELKIETSGNEYLSEACKKNDAQLYVFGALGRDYADLDFYNDQNIKIYFQDYNHPEYLQFEGLKFIPYLSIIDLLFHHGEESKNIIMSGNISKSELLTT